MTKIIRAAALSILNQAVSSGANFVFGALLVRQLSQDGFGAWGLAFSALLLALNAGEALFITPMTIAIAQMAQTRTASYVKTAFFGASAVAGVLALPLSVACAIMFRSAGAQNVVSTSAAVGLAAFFLILKETLVRICYALRREGSVLALNGAFGVVTITLAGLPLTRASTPFLAVAYYALGGAAAGMVGVGVLKLHRAATTGSVTGEMKSLFREGRWYLGSNIAYWLRLQTPTLASAWTLGLASVGALSAGRLLVAPPVFLNPALGQIALPRLARLAVHEQDRRRFARGVLAFGLTLGTASATYCAVLWLAFETVSQLILGTGRTVPKPIVAAWCVFVMALAVRNAFEVALKARREARRILVANGVAAMAALSVCVAASKVLGEAGVVLGAAVAELGVVVMMFMLSRGIEPLSRGETSNKGTPASSEETLVAATGPETAN